MRITLQRWSATAGVVCATPGLTRSFYRTSVLRALRRFLGFTVYFCVYEAYGEHMTTNQGPSPEDVDKAIEMLKAEFDRNADAIAQTLAEFEAENQ